MGRVTFCGACGSVTGSCTYLRFGDTKVLVDCGLYQGPEELEQRNWRKFLFKPQELTAVVLTHAHLDHSGLLPRLVADGFEGPIYCTKPSRGLVSLILQDAGHLQEEQASYARKKRLQPAPRSEASLHLEGRAPDTQAIGAGPFRRDDRDRTWSVFPVSTRRPSSRSRLRRNSSQRRAIASAELGASPEMSAVTGRRLSKTQSHRSIILRD